MDRSGVGRSQPDEQQRQEVRLVETPVTGLPGLAQGLTQQGLEVTGGPLTASAWAQSQLVRAGVRVLQTAHPTRLRPRTQLVVHGPEVGRSHPVRLGALRRGIRQTTPTDWLREQMRDRMGVAVSGYRGASRAAAMIGFILRESGQDPSYYLNRPAPQLGGWSRQGKGAHLVASCDPAGTEVSEIGPSIAVYLDATMEAPASLEAIAPETDVLLDAPEHVAAMARERLRFVERCSLERGADWWGTDLREESGRFRFRVFHRGRYVIEVGLRAVGRGQVVPALAAVAVCQRLGVSPTEIRQGLEEFNGLARDFESRGSYRGVSLLDDESEGAGPVEDVLRLSRRVLGLRRLWAVLSTPATERIGGDVRAMVATFTEADRVVLVGHGCGEDTLDPASLIRALNTAGIRSWWVMDLDEAISELDRHLEPGDVLLTLGNGDVGMIADAFIRRLPRDRQNG